MIKAYYSPQNDAIDDHYEQESYVVTPSVIQNTSSGSPVDVNGKYDFLNSQLESAITTNKPNGFGQYTCEIPSPSDFDLDREPRWAFEGEGLSCFSDKPKPLKVLVITWNLNGRKPGEILEQLLNTRNTGHHIIAIATQECLKSIGMSFIDNSKDEWVKLLKTHLGARFEMLRDHTMNAIHLAVFARKEIFPFIRDVEDAEVATGFANILGNKGGVGISFKVLGNSFLFLSCHLTCGQSGAEKRHEDLERILENMPLPWYRLEQEYPSEYERSLFSHFDFVFCAGDLNYRIDLDPEETLARFEAEGFEHLLEKDQLNLGKETKKKLFQPFYEGEIRFGPTYKYELTTQSLDATKEKRPAWTDRILYAFKNSDVKVEQKSYDSNRKVLGSDHRPVFSQFLLKLDLSHQKKINANKEPQVASKFFCGL